MKKLIIFYTEDKKSYRVVQPAPTFDGNFEGLVRALSPCDCRGNPVYYKYVLI